MAGKYTDLRAHTCCRRPPLFFCRLEAEDPECVAAGVEPARGVRQCSGLIRLPLLLPVLQAASGRALQNAALQTRESPATAGSIYPPKIIMLPSLYVHFGIGVYYNLIWHAVSFGIVLFLSNDCFCLNLGFEPTQNHMHPAGCHSRNLHSRGMWTHHWGLVYFFRSRYVFDMFSWSLIFPFKPFLDSPFEYLAERWQ